MVVGKRNAEEGGRRLLNQGRFYLSQNLITPKRWKPRTQKDKNAPITKKGKDDDGNHWIVCDICDKQYHLQCSRITYDEEGYYEINIENELFIWEECE